MPYKPDASTEYEQQRCKLDFYLPEKATGFPTIVWFHGGGLQNGDKATQRSMEEALARQMLSFIEELGVVPSVEYRLRLEYEALFGADPTIDQHPSTTVSLACIIVGWYSNIRTPAESSSS